MATLQTRRAHGAGSAPRRITPGLLLLAAAVLVLVSQTVLDTLADQSEAWHWIQHGVVFLAGSAAGAAAALLYAAGRTR
jgi:hypothetical protein